LKKQFTLSRAEVVAADPAVLRAEILTATGSETEADSILRSLERLGTDSSIEHYQVTHVAGRRAHGMAGSGSWRVHVERATAPGAEAATPEPA
jgi:hypothetical protein